MLKRSLFTALLTAAVCSGWSASLCAGSASNEKTRDKAGKKAPKTGDTAPVFELKMLDREKSVALRDFNGKRPVILFFGSYT
ncbi:MAG: hypothetical protein MI923_07765 [Phycisphaerales bacterium]|nr:hypothetical protein [Phycisphaerales bacterium]